MEKYYIIALLSFFVLTAQPALVDAQVIDKQASVKITGEVTTPLSISFIDLQQYPQTTVTRKDKDGKDHIYTGVVVASILQKAGVTLGKDLRGKNLAKYVKVEAADGYQVVFALAELDKDFTDRTIILADMVDGQLLATGEGPFRIIVQDEKKPARCIKEVIAIKVQFAK